MKRYLIILFCCSLLACNTDKFDSKVTLPKIFENGMVLQRNQKNHVWGKGIPNKKVRVSIAGLMGSTEVSSDSTWSLKLPESKEGGPFVLQVNNQKIGDVYIGDVWLAGGQSNMEWALKSAVLGAEKEFAEGGYPEIRFFKVPNSYSAHPQEDLQGGEWKVANKENLPNFSSVAWFFAKKNHLEKGVPVGIIESNWGGTPAEGWTDAAVLASMDASYSAEAKEIIDQAEEWEEKVFENEKNRNLRNELVSGPDSLEAMKVSSIDYDDSGWRTINLPKSNPMQHIAWIRKEIKLSTSQEAVLHLPNIDQMAYIYLNGNLLHYKDWGAPVPEIDIPASLIFTGTNVLTIRAINTWNNQPRVGELGEMYVLQGSNKISLEGNWAYSTNIIEPQLPKVEWVNWKPGMMYNSMINPLISYPIKGAIWYQGESNAGRAEEYEELFSAMITNWRSKWGLGDFPFLFVQLANYMERKSPQPESDWAYLREAQSKTLSLPNTGMAVIIDIGEAGDIHPKNKRDVGERLWLQAKKIAYNEAIVSNGPIFKTASVQEGKIVVTFEDVADGLKISDGDNSVKGFIVGTSNGRFQEVLGEISGVNEVVLNLDVSNPIEIRYAWADNPEVNLVNTLGLPTAPFRYSFKSN